MSQIEKLQALQAKLKQKNTQSKMTKFENLVVVNVGCEPTEYYPKLKNVDGTNQKDSEGKDIRSDKPSGWMYTFTEFSTARTVKIVLRERKQLTVLKAYQASGSGYDIKNARMVFIEQDSTLTDY